jgi:uncharacterized membrane protein (UPF0127 family)
MPGRATVTIRDKQWQAYLATTYQELLQGLSGVETIPPGTGMLFVLPADQAVTITTQLMRFPIDIIFISSSLAVVDVARGVVPGLLVSEATPVRYFLEVNAGEATGIEAGDSVSIVVYQTAAAFDPSQIVGFAIPLVALGFVCSMAGGIASALAGHHSSRLLPRTTSRVYFVGPCKVSLGRCLTHNQPVGKKTRCPESPLTDEEWEAAYELVIAAFPEGQPNPWVDGWWPQTLEEAQMVIRRYEVGLLNAVSMYEAKSRAAVDLYRRSAERAAYHYKQYVMREYERRPHREAVAERERVEASPKLAGPRERTELPIELHYFADTADHIEGSMNHNGLRAKIDQTFREAIARAQEGR